jgi:NAD(P)-dependent dehydrogenase (short-subunit alcohol dehydrogenase family)
VFDRLGQFKLPYHLLINCPPFRLQHRPFQLQYQVNEAASLYHTKRTNMKTILITGASTGLGKATAKLFQAKGWNVIATMRSPEKETELQQLENITLLPLDVTISEQVQQTVKAALASGDIDVVFNNAGYGLIGPIESHTEEQIRSQFDTNFFGTLAVIRAFIPYFRKRNKGLFINTTSLCGLVSNPQSAIYNASKWALQGLAESLSYDLAQFNIGIKNVAPGGIKSDFMKAMQVTEDEGYAATLAKMNEGFTDGTLMEFTEAEQIAEVVYQAATDEKDQLTYPAGNDAVRLYAKRLAEGPEAYRIGLSKYLNLQSPYPQA